MWAPRKDMASKKEVSCHPKVHVRAERHPLPCPWVVVPGCTVQKRSHLPGCWNACNMLGSAAAMSSEEPQAWMRYDAENRLRRLAVAVAPTSPLPSLEFCA